LDADSLCFGDLSPLIRRAETEGIEFLGRHSSRPRRAPRSFNRQGYPTPCRDMLAMSLRPYPQDAAGWPKAQLRSLRSVDGDHPFVPRTERRPRRSRACASGDRTVFPGKQQGQSNAARQDGQSAFKGVPPVCCATRARTSDTRTRFPIRLVRSLDFAGARRRIDHYRCHRRPRLRALCRPRRRTFGHDADLRGCSRPRQEMAICQPVELACDCVVEMMTIAP